MASFVGGADYAAASAAASFTINPVPPTVAVTDAGGTYNGSAFAATATVAGHAGGRHREKKTAPSLRKVAPALGYYAGKARRQGRLWARRPVNAGTYTVVASFPSSFQLHPPAAADDIDHHARLLQRRQRREPRRRPGRGQQRQPLRHHRHGGSQWRTARCSRWRPAAAPSPPSPPSTANGANPFGGLVEDSSGNLFGTTALGGTSNDGTVFEVAAGSGTITTLASFNGTNGGSPYAGLVEDSSGNLFGTTTLGGANNDGTVFEIAAGSGTITTLASFNGTNTGQCPRRRPGRGQQRQPLRHHQRGRPLR